MLYTQLPGHCRGSVSKGHATGALSRAHYICGIVDGLWDLIEQLEVGPGITSVKLTQVK